MVKTTAKKASSKGAGKTNLQDAMRQGITAVENGDKAEALKIFQQTAELHPGSSDVWVWVGGTSPHLDDAEVAFEKAYTLDPNNEEASLGLRWVRLRRTAVLNPVGDFVPMPSMEAADVMGDAGGHQYGEPELLSSVLSTVKCPNCGKFNDASEQFCLQCGQDMRSVLMPTSDPDAKIQLTSARSGMSRQALVFTIVGALLVIIGIVYYFVGR